MYRWLVLVFFVIATGTSAYHRRRAHAAGGQIPRSAEGSRAMAARALLTLPLLVTLVVYFLAPGWLWWAELALPEWVRLAGIAVTAAAVAGSIWTLRSIGRNISETVLTKEGQELVTHGPYRWIRHPLYTTGVMLIAGMGLMADNWLMLVWAAVAALAFGFFVIPIEEGELVKRFGDSYVRYQRISGRMLPRLRAGA